MSGMFVDLLFFFLETFCSHNWQNRKKIGSWRRSWTRTTSVSWFLWHLLHAQVRGARKGSGPGTDSKERQMWRSQQKRQHIHTYRTRKWGAVRWVGDFSICLEIFCIWLGGFIDYTLICIVLHLLWLSAEFPWVTAVIYKVHDNDDIVNVYKCGGSLIAPNVCSYLGSTFIYHSNQIKISFI